MIIIYNIIQLAVLLILSPLLGMVAIFNQKYRNRILRRCGSGFKDLYNLPAGRRKIWLHALSVGEIASARILVRKIRDELPEAVILFSCTTASGEEYARSFLKDEVDTFFTFPFDFIWLTNRYLRVISPDLFIMIETDFWPNFLFSLKKNKIPALLVNGRISSRSYRFYRFIRPVFRSMLLAFDYLGVQRKMDRENMIGLGLPVERIFLPGNLKYEGLISGDKEMDQVVARSDFSIPDESLLLVAGSTHPGEEEIIFDFLGQLAADFPDLRLIIAPRNIERSGDLLEMARSDGFSCGLKSDSATGCRILILDTLGELAKLYGLADLTFVGGSLVPLGGHNPLEPASLGKPVMFGPHMDEFCDISAEMVEEGAAVQVEDRLDLISKGRKILGDPSLRDELGERGLNFIRERRGAVDKYYRLIEELLKIKESTVGVEN